MKVINALFLIVVLFACSCSHPKDLVYKDIHSFKLGQAGMQQSALKMDIRMFNPNGYCMKLKDADVDVFINGKLLGKMEVNGSCAVPRLDTFLMPVILNVDMKNVLPNTWQLFMNSEVEIKLAGTIKAGRHGLFIKVPLDYEGKQDIRSSLNW